MPHEPAANADVEMFSYQDSFGGHVAGVRPKQSPDDVAAQPPPATVGEDVLRLLAAKDAEIEKLEHAVETQAQKLEWYEERFKVQATHIHKNTVIATPGLQEEIDRLRDALRIEQKHSKAMFLYALFAFAAGCVLGGWIL